MKKLILVLVLLSPALHAEVFDIKQFSLDQYRGKVVYLDFWASWCKPCRKSFPWMNELTRQLPTDQFSVVTINLDEETEAMQDFLRKVPANFPVYHDASGIYAEKFQLKGMPTSLLIDRNGDIVSRHTGYYEKKKSTIQSEIKALL